MKSDSEFYKIFKACPEMLEVLVPGEVKAKYTFDSIAFKDISRTTDGFLQPDDPKTDRFLLEFQVKHDWSIYGRTLLMMIQYHLDNPGVKIRGIIVFITDTRDPKTEPW